MGYLVSGQDMFLGGELSNVWLIGHVAVGIANSLAS
jgi:hypothetical protein